MAVSEPIGQRRNRQSTGVRGHVPSVGDERHRTVDGAVDDLSDHHCGGQPNNQPGPPLVVLVLLAEKCVVMLPRFKRVGVRSASSSEQQFS